MSSLKAIPDAGMLSDMSIKARVAAGIGGGCDPGARAARRRFGVLDTGPTRPSFHDGESHSL